MEKTTPNLVLVTGSHGLLGSYIIDALRREGIPFVRYDRSSKDPLPSTISACIHAGGVVPLSPEVAGVGEEAYVQGNIEGTKTLIAQLSTLPNLETLINLGSAAEYGPYLECVEEDTPTRPTSAYGISKLKQSQLVEAFAKERPALSTYNLRIFNVADARISDHEVRKPGRLSLFSLLRRHFTESDSETVQVSHPDTVRDFVAPDDIAEAVLAALTRASLPGYHVINICSGIATTLKELVDQFAQAHQRSVTIVATTQTPDISFGTPKKAHDMLGWIPKVPLAESVRRATHSVRVIVVGAGVGASELLERISHERRAELTIVGLVDDAQEKQGSLVHGYSVLGAVDDLPTLITAYRAHQVLISTPSVGKELVQRVTHLVPPGFPVKILPSISSVLLGKATLAHVRDVDPSDLIGRPLVKLDQERIASAATGKTFLVTGGAGSIGSEVVRQLWAAGAQQVHVIDAWEEGIFNLLEEFSQTGVRDPRIVAHIANVRDRERMNEIFASHPIDVIIHAAAYKHVPLMEEHPGEAIKTNVEGTRNVLEAMLTHNISDFVLVSTDKAVHPSSVMGASKREAELLVKEYARSHPEKRFCAVRFGNVLNSSGSVLPTFMRQIAHRGPVTVTHKDMTRYFMTIPEAVSLVLQSWIIAENGQILLLDMGEPVRIYVLAHTLIRLHGFEPHIDIEIVEVGVRPGEKIHEELSYDVTKVRKSATERIFIAEDLSQ